MSRNVVVIGGGTGTFAVLTALKDTKAELTALMTMADDGGSNKVLRDEFGLLPTSGIRQALVALSDQPSLMRELFMYRFHQGTGISGMTFGNLFLAAMADIVGSQEKAIEETSKFLSIKGHILPISFDDVRLVATYEDGSVVVGEHLIDEPEKNAQLKITDFRTEPVGTINPKAAEALRTADLIILGPGDFYTNTVANLVITGVTEQILKSSAKVLFILNLMTKPGETYNYSASNYLEDLDKYLPLARLNYLLLNSDTEYPPAMMQKYQTEQSSPVQDDLNNFDLPSNISVIRTPLRSSAPVHKQKGDTLQRSMIRHDTEKLRAAILEILTELE